MLFRKLRDEGFREAQALPTRITDGSVDQSALCRAYDTLRQTHVSEDIVSQFYSKDQSGRMYPDDYRDTCDMTLASTYGLFVKQ